MVLGAIRNVCNIRKPVTATFFQPPQIALPDDESGLNSRMAASEQSTKLITAIENKAYRLFMAVTGRPLRRCYRFGTTPVSGSVARLSAWTIILLTSVRHEPHEVPHFRRAAAAAARARSAPVGATRRSAGRAQDGQPPGQVGPLRGVPPRV